MKFVVQTPLLMILRVPFSELKELVDWFSSEDQEFFSVTKALDEISVVCSQNDFNLANLSLDGEIEKNWRMLRIDGPLDFQLVGILASCTQVLADAKIPVFCLSTFLTDYILVKADFLEAACDSLRTAGHEVETHQDHPGQ